MDLKIPVPPPKRGKSSARASRAEEIKITEGSKFGRSFGRGVRHYGIINLKTDSSQYLSPTVDLEFDPDLSAKNKLVQDLNDLAQSRTGCIVWYTIEYFQKSDKVIPYVDILLGKCLIDEYIMEVTTKNFYSISNIVLYGENIKTQMLNSLKHIHEDLLSFGFTYESSDNPHLFLKYYNHSIAVAYYKFVSLLFFRMRKHVDSEEAGRYKILARPSFSALKYLLTEQSLESLKLLTKLVQLNLRSIASFFLTEVEQFVDNVISTRQHYKKGDKGWYWLTCTLDIIYFGPILKMPLYNCYKNHLGNELEEYVVTENVIIIDRMSDCIIAEKLDDFHIIGDDIWKTVKVIWC